MNRLVQSEEMNSKRILDVGLEQLEQNFTLYTVIPSIFTLKFPNNFGKVGTGFGKVLPHYAVMQDTILEPVAMLVKRTQGKGDSNLP